MELTEAWANLTRQAGEMVGFLGEDIEGVLSVPVQGAGNGASDGSMRQAIVAQLEGWKLKVLDKALEPNHNPRARPAWSWRNRDKLTTAWLVDVPGAQSSLSTPWSICLGTMFSARIWMEDQT